MKRGLLNGPACRRCPKAARVCLLILLGASVQASAQAPAHAPSQTPMQSPAQAATTNAPPAAASADSDYGTWETVVRIDRFISRDPTPAATDRRKHVECLRRQDFRASALLQRSPLTSDLVNKCWLTSEREEAHRSQVKWACRDGTTAEIATRSEGENRLGYQLVVNSPGEGGLSIRAESIRIAPACGSPLSPGK